MHWEPVKSDRFEILRAAVPGGWLVVCNPVRSWDQASDFIKLGDPQFRRIETILLRMEESERAARLAFLPDSEHQWDADNPAAAPLNTARSLEP
jgi:hypothetical protein